MKVQIEESWRRQLQEEFDKPYFEHLVGFVKEEYARYTVFPPGSRIFHAYNTCPFEKVKVVILGQDPYHEPGQYYGLCFSVMDGVPFPPSLVNIFKEIQNDLGKPTSPFGTFGALGGSGSIIDQCHSDRTGTSGRFASGKRLGRVYGCRDPATE